MDCPNCGFKRLDEVINQLPENICRKKFTIIGVDLYMLYDKQDQHVVDSRPWYMIVDKAGKPRVIDTDGKGFHSYLINKSSASHVIDHINGNSIDNRRVNLREATKSQNASNRKNRTNQHGYPGLLKNGDNWYVSICVNGVEYKSKFKSKKEAVTWRYNKQVELLGEFNPDKRTLKKVLKDLDEKPLDYLKPYQRPYQRPVSTVFKKPNNNKQTKFFATLTKDGVEHCVFYGRDSYALNRFKSSKKYKQAVATGNWEFARTQANDS
jgi:hypothetical protein